MSLARSDDLEDWFVAVPEGERAFYVRLDNAGRGALGAPRPVALYI